MKRLAAAYFVINSILYSSAVLGEDVELSWQESARAATYDLYVGTSNPPSILVSGINGTRYRVTGLAGGTTYYWYAVAHASCDATRTTHTAVRSFAVPGICQPPTEFTLRTPVSGDTDVIPTPTLTWSPSANAGSYDVFLGRSSPPALYASEVNTESIEIPKLLPATRYYWQVVAKSGCDPRSNLSSAIRSFTVTSSCTAPGTPAITFVPQGPISLGQTYAITWTEAAGMDAGGSYVVERSQSPTFSTIVDSQQTTSISASFVSTSTGTYHHRVRAVAGCDSSRVSSSSVARSVAVAAGSPNVVFTVHPQAIITKLGDKLEDQKTTFTIENIGTAAVQVLVGRQELSSVPFFNLIDPFGGDAAFVTLEPRKPKTMEIRFSGPPNDKSGSYQGIVYLAATGEPFAINPLAYVSLKVGGETSAPPAFLVDGIQAEYAFFPPASGDDSGRPPISVDILNSGTTSMELAAEIGPELWLTLEPGWNATAIPANSFRPVRLSTRRNRAPNGSALPRYTFLTIRNRSGQSARLLIQDNGASPVSSGRASQLDADERSYVIPLVVSRVASTGEKVVSRVRLSNVGGDAVQAELFFTPATRDGFDATAVKRATVLVPPNDVVNLTDPLVQLFGLTSPVSGQLEVRAAQEKIAFLTSSSAVQMILKTGGMHGYQIPTLLRGEGARVGSQHVVGGITASAELKTHLTLAETTGREKTTVRVVLYDKDAAKRGEQLVEVPRYGSIQLENVAQTLGSATIEAGKIELTVESGGGAVVGVATVQSSLAESAACFVSQPATSTIAVSTLGRHMRASSDGVEISATNAPNQALFVPSVINGIAPNPGQSTYRTHLGLIAATDSPSTFRVSYSDQESRQTHVKTVTISPRATVEYANVVENLFGLPAGVKSQGWLLIDVDAGGRAYAKLDAKPGSAIVGDVLPVVSLFSEALSGSASAKPLYYDGLDQSVDPTRGTRSNLVLNELGGEPATVTARLYEAGNRTRPIAERDFDVPARGQLRLESLFSALGLESEERKKDRTNLLVVVTPKSSRGLVSALLTTIEKQTGETKNTLLVPSGGIPATGLQRVMPSPPPTTRRRAVRR